MGMVQRLRDAVRGRQASRVTQELGNRLYLNPLCSDYENVFAQVRPLINDMTMVLPFGVGKNGGRLPAARTPELSLLQSPNDQMGWVDFAGAMFATWLTEDELDIHVHLDRRGRVIGYSILPPGSKMYLGNGRYQWQASTEDGIVTLTRAEVMQLRFSRSPKNLMQGISPATSIRAWAQTEDVLAQYQRAYIENGAIPASITFIRASSRERFDAAKQELENKLRGAKNKGKTIYVWRQFDNNTGESVDQVEVKTIQGNNSTLAIKELSDIINDHLNKAYGVSNFILGDDSSAKYDNAELSDYQFIKRRVYPALTAFWNQFQFELDRITGGLGYSIQFELELPDLTERKKVKAETAEKNVGNLIKLIDAGSSPTDAVKALGLPESWKNVANGIFSKTTAGAISPQVTSEKLDSCGHCGSCDHLNHKASPAVVRAEADSLPEMSETERAIYDELIKMATRIMAEEPELDFNEVVEKIDELLEKEALKGQETAAKAVELLADKDVAAEIETSVRAGLKLPDALGVRIKDRTEELVKNYGEETRRIFEETLAGSENLPAAEIRKRLRAAMPTWQAERIARNETVYAFKSGRLEEDKAMAEKFGLHIKLVWRTSDDPAVCPVCAAMDGEETDLGTAFADRVETEDGEMVWEHSKWNDNGQIPEAHVNCRCYFDEVVE